MDKSSNLSSFRVWGLRRAESHQCDTNGRVVSGESLRPNLVFASLSSKVRNGAVKQAAIRDFCFLPDVQTLQLVMLEQMIAGVNEPHRWNSAAQRAI